MKLKTLGIFVALTVGFAAWFAMLMPWDRLPDPDAFYHAKMSLLTWQSGTVKHFPWLDLTALGKNFADQHYLFHVLQSPFVVFWGLYNGSRISSLLFAIVALLAISFVFYKLRLKPFWAWPALLAITDPFSTRMILGKASPLAIAVFFVAIGCLLLDDTDSKSIRFIKSIRLQPRPNLKNLTNLINLKNLLIFVCGLIFALLHGGWIMLIGGVAAILVGRILFDVALDNRGFFASVRRARWSNLFAVISGIAVGLALHPGRAELFQLLWIQVFKIGVLTPNNLAMGMEWNAADLGGGVGAFSIFGVILLLCVVGLLFARKSSLRVSAKQSMDCRTSSDSARNDNSDFVDCEVPPCQRGLGGFPFIRPIIILGPLVAALFALTIKSVRFAEYFQPILALWTAYLAQMVDWENIFEKLKLNAGGEDRSSNVEARMSNVGITDNGSRITDHGSQQETTPPYYIKRLIKSFSDNLLPATVAICSVAIIFNHVWSSYTSLHFISRFMDDQFRTPMQAISAQAQPGDRVYHASWDEFPVLFAQDANLRYVSGLDPTFLYEASSTMALEYQDFAFKAASSTPDALWNFVHVKLDAKYLMIDDYRWQDLAGLIEKDARYQKLAEGEGGVAYKVSSDH